MAGTKTNKVPQAPTGVEEDEEIAYTSGTCVEKTIETSKGPRTIEFYSVSLRTGFELKVIAKNLMTALAMLWKGLGQENGVKTTRKSYRQADGATVNEEHQDLLGIDHHLAQVVAIEREKAIRGLIESFADEKSQTALARFVMDSAKKQFARPVTDEQAKKWGSTVDVEVFVTMLRGALAANAGVLGPLGQSLSGLFGKALGRINSLAEESAVAPTVPSESPAPVEESTAGEPSPST